MAKTKALVDKSFVQALLSAYRLLSPRERYAFIGIVLFSFFGGCADVAALMAVYPLVSILVQPDFLQSQPLVNWLWLAFGAPTEAKFIVMLTLGSAAVVTLGSSMNTYAQISANRFAADCQEQFGRRLMTMMLHAPYSWHIVRSPLLLSSVFQNHVVLWSRDVIRRIPTMASQLATVLLPAIGLIAWSPLGGTLVIVFSVTCLASGLAFLRRRTSRLMQEKRREEERLHVFLSETLQGIKDVKLSSREDNFISAFTRSFHVTTKNFSATGNWNLLPTQFVLIAGQSAIMFGALGLYLYGIKGGELASAMAIVILIVSRVLPAMNRLGTAVGSLANVQTWVDTLCEITSSLRVAVIPTPNPPAASLQWRTLSLIDVAYTYPNESEPALYGANLEITFGHSYAFTGTSGAGKSTLVDIVLGLLQPSKGRVELDGQVMDENRIRSWQSMIGYVPQMPLISDASLRENIAFGIPAHLIEDEKVLRCLSLAHLTDILEDLPFGLNTPLGDRGLRLSGGQRQRVAIARALYNDPEVLVLDEATSALDTLSEFAIQQALLSLRGKITIISIAHRFSTIRSCDCIFLIDDGRLVAQGKFDSLLRENDLFRRLASDSEPLETTDATQQSSGMPLSPAQLATPTLSSESPRLSSLVSGVAS